MPGPCRKNPDQPPPFITVCSGPPWRAWLDGLAKQAGMPASCVVDHALRRYAKAEGWAAPPNRLLGWVPRKRRPKAPVPLPSGGPQEQP
jgi:hypothetical protein